MSAQVAARVRDANFNGTSQANTISLLSYSQQVINGALTDVTAQSSLALQPRTCLYQVSAFVPGAVRILAIKDASGRDLEPMMEFAQLAQTDLKWIVRTADAPRGWCYIGRDLIVIYPATRLGGQTLTVTYAQLTPALATTADATVVPNETDDAIYDLTEALLLLKNRDLNAVTSAMQRFQERMKALDSSPNILPVDKPGAR